MRLLVILADPRAHDVATERLGAPARPWQGRCDDATSPWRPWCVAAAYDTGTAAALPAGKVLVGLTIELETGKDVATALSDKVSFTAWAVGTDGKVKLTTVKPTSDDESKAVGEAVFATAAVFKAKAKTAKLPTDLAGYVKSLKGAATRTREVRAASGRSGPAPPPRRAQGPARSARSIETPDKQNGVFATILTDAWE